MTPLHLAVLFLNTFIVAFANEPCDLYYTQVNCKLHNLITKTVFSQSAEDCLSKCSTKMLECQSINYHSTEKKCELNKASHLSNPEALLPAIGYTYIRDPSQLSLSKRCNDKFCSESLYCVLDVGDDYLCKPCEGRVRLHHLSCGQSALNYVSVVICDDLGFWLCKKTSRKA